MNIPNNHIVTPCSEMLTLKVITNPNLLENILIHLPDGLMKNLNLRLINNQFNKTFIRLIRKNLQKIEIEFIGKNENIGKKNLGPLGVYINYRFVELAFVNSYFRFIKDFADVKVDRVITKNLWKLHHSYHRTLHDSIIFTLIGDNDIKALIGIEDICFRCQNCYDIKTKCQEYGPANAYTLKDIKTPCHFKKLIVTDVTLCTIANNCMRWDVPVDVTEYKLLKLYVNHFIKCNKLEIWLSDVTKFDENSKLPREVLDLMLKKWNVKRVEIKFIFNSKYKPYAWFERGLFTKFRFNDSYDSVGKSTMNLKFDQVDIDLSDSYYCAKDICSSSLQSCGYENIIANVRRIFPTDKITIQFSHEYYNNGGAINTTIDSLVKVAHKEIQRDLKIDIRYYTKIETFKFHNPITHKVELSVIPSNIYINSKEMHCSVQESSIHCYHRRLKENRNEKWIGRQCTVVDSKINFILNIDIFIKENDKSYEFSEEQLKEQPDAFVKHFLPPFHS